MRGSLAGTRGEFPSVDNSCTTGENSNGVLFVGQVHERAFLCGSAGQVAVGIKIGVASPYEHMPSKRTLKWIRRSSLDPGEILDLGTDISGVPERGWRRATLVENEIVFGTFFAPAIEH